MAVEVGVEDGHVSILGCGLRMRAVLQQKAS